MCRGKPIAQLTSVNVKRKRTDPSALQGITDAMPIQTNGPTRDFVRRMRDDERY